ncbi:MAG: Na+/H+ antiporter NhaA type [Micavibrio sp.]|nr:Na+/H+ antiporter NhaA type [Micavibrio sp.]
MKDFFKTEAAGGIVLMIAAAIALVIANAPFQALQSFLQNPTLVFAVNDGLMVVFFFIVGLEVRHEMAHGALSSRAKMRLPLLAAVGGMVVPALVYVAINRHVPGNGAGWAIPAATDIAFALCVMALAGSRVPQSLKILLLAIAVIDDIGAIIVIALFYGHGFHVLPFATAILIIGIMWWMSRRALPLWPYIIMATGLWAAVLLSGVHATLAGVVAAMFMPERFGIEKKLHPWVTFGVLPVFGLVNAGVSFAGMGPDSFGDPLTLGIILGLVAGKPLGIMAMIGVAAKMRWAPWPEGANFGAVTGMAVLCGIGFTMSLFIGGLAFGEGEQAAIRLGVLTGSVVAAVVGFGLLRMGTRRV